MWTPATRNTSTSCSPGRARNAAGNITASTPNIGILIEDILDTDQTPCSLCARLRRGVLYRIAKEVGATKIALGHHADDFIETLLLNLFFAGSLKAMPAKLVSDNGEHVVIRPLVYVGEDEARLYAKECELPIIGCCCPACGDLGLQRQRAKKLIMELEIEHPGVKQLDAEGAEQRRAAASARHAAEPARRTASEAPGACCYGVLNALKT